MVRVIALFIRIVRSALTLLPFDKLYLSGWRGCSPSARAFAVEPGAHHHTTNSNGWQKRYGNEKKFSCGNVVVFLAYKLEFERRRAKKC